MHNTPSPAPTPDLQEVLGFLRPLSADYPDLVPWFHTKVTPGLAQGTRHLIRLERHGQLVGVGIAKNEGGERKICTVRVAPSHAGRGLGLRLFDGLLTWLGTDQPHLTVTDHRFPAYARIFDHYGFTQSAAHPGLYVPQATELAFNDAPVAPAKILIP